MQSDGLKPDPKKIEAIMNMPKPTDVNWKSHGTYQVSCPVYP